MLFYLLHAILVCYLLFPSVVFSYGVKCKLNNNCLTTEECGRRHNNKFPGIAFPCESLDNWNPKSHRNYHLIPTENCGYIPYSNKITAGTETVPGEFPWIGLLGFKENRSFFGICGCSLINSRHVITAAHCFNEKNDVRLDYVRLREYDLRTKTDVIYGTRHQAIDVQIEMVILHPGWNNSLKTTMKNDIALLRLVRTVTEEHIIPICLPLKNQREKLSYIVAGWGKTDPYDSELNPLLLKGNLKGQPFDLCNTCKGNEEYCPLTDNQICAQGYRGVDVCKGDSGGPLMYTEYSKTYLEGITSFSPRKDCGEQQIPSIFTKVHSYIHWILDEIEK